MQLNHREAKNNSGEQIKPFMEHQMAAGKPIFVYFSFSSVLCGSHLYFRILVPLLLRVKIMGDDIL